MRDFTVNREVGGRGASTPIEREGRLVGGSGDSRVGEETSKRKSSRETEQIRGAILDEWRS